MRTMTGLFMGLAVLLAACGGGGGDPLGIEEDAAFQSALDDLQEAGGSVAVADLTDFEWDALHVFAEGASRDDIAAAAGGPVINDEFFFTAGQLWVFALDGAPVRALVTVPDNLTGTRDPLTATARIDADPGGLLRLSDG